jgi:type II secretory pathway component PulK
MRKGSALLMALWIIAVLSVMVLSFANEAHLQTGINVYVRERNRVNRLVEAGTILAEVVIADYANVSEWSEGEDVDKLLEDDRWLREKRQLKEGRPCEIGPILVDEENPDSGTVKVGIRITRGLNVNELVQDSDSNWRLRWEMLLKSHGIPEDYEVEAYDAQHHTRGRYNLINLLIASFADWVDADDNASVVDGDECGAEAHWYEEEYEDDKVDDEFKRYPRNGPIPDIRELSYIRGFRDYPVVLTGGVLNPEDDPKDQITVRGIADMFNTLGSAKVYVNDCTRDELLTVPGIFDEEDEEDLEKSTENIEAILGAKSEEPDYDVDETQEWWQYKDFSDLQQRVSDYGGNAQVGSEASNYLLFKPDDSTIFEITIECESLGMTRKVKAKAYLKDKEVRYVEWEEDPVGDRKESGK